MTVRTLLKELWHPKVSSSQIDDNELKAYWSVYGGLKAIWGSAYFWVALALMLLLRPLWCSGEWLPIASDLLPGLLGFSIGALAIMLAAPGFKVFEIIAEGGIPRSHFMIMASRLVHFIIVQSVAIIIMLVAKTYPSGWTNGIGFLLMAYAVMTAVSIALTLFGLARMLNFSVPPEDDEPTDG